MLINQSALLSNGELVKDIYICILWSICIKHFISFSSLNADFSWIDFLDICCLFTPFITTAYTFVS